MTERLSDVKGQIQNVRQLKAVVVAMRGIAASRAQRSRSLLAGVDAYSRVMSQAIGLALSFIPEPPISPESAPGTSGLILFCAEQGFAGAFSEHVLDAVPDISSSHIFLVGTRGNTVAMERGLAPAWTTKMVTRVDAVPFLANQVADALYESIETHPISRIDIVFSRSDSNSRIRIERRSLLPIDFTKFDRPINSQPPLTTLPPDTLLENLTAEYVYAQICEAAMLAFEAENDARMMAMASANANIETKLDTLSQKEQTLRQAEITTEIIELAAGAEASAG